MKTVSSLTRTSFREKGSKFIGYLFSVASTDEFDEQLQQIKAKYPDATHHCYGWRIDPNNLEEFAQDDGEPSGTAGLPILNKLKSYEVVNCGCIVVRYYGGTKLGKSGLIEAYGRSAEHCLQKASLATLIATQNFKIQYPYSGQSHIDRLKNQFDLKELNAEYLEEVTVTLACRTSQSEQFGDALHKLEHKGFEIELLGPSFVTMSS
ncbi:IMPACT family protein [Fodinibius halophilus]|uniref:YigZ family protein n=1 Tax=Fodinibius halophilus TaxID=1736908 RepID=A0A6M1TB59_9BACT|nr:YigZ family protein [Fodinibius halophilus]NGP88204.1 YigZ family protein [Fodinibius halophilus]